MASFAKLDENNVVTNVIVVGDDVPTSNGPLGDNDMHVDGETYCAKTFGGTWKQCSSSGAFRKQNAGIGDTYDAVKDKFIRPQPYPSWTWEDYDWNPPVPYPEDDTMLYIWDEEGQQWTPAPVQ